VISLKRFHNYNTYLKSIDQPIAFILGKYITSGLGISRYLGRLKIPVVWLDSNPKQIGFLSKYCTGIVSPPPENNEEYIGFLINLGKILSQKGVLLPIGDTEIYATLKYKQKLKKYYHFSMPDLEITNKLLDKSILYRILDKLKIAHPKTYFPQNLTDVKKLSNNILYPCFIKPSYSSYFVIDFKTKLFNVESSDQLINLYNKTLIKNYNVLIQEIIPGEANCMYGLNAYYDKDCSPNGVFMYRRIREWPFNTGCGCLIESVEVPELEEIINPLIKHIKFHGIVDAEFKKDPRDKKFKLIEINPRSWEQNSLPSRCGINLPYIAYMQAIGKEVDKVICKQKQMKWLFIFDDILSTLTSMKKNELTFQEWIHSFKGKIEYAIFAKDDPNPFFALFFKSISFSTFSALQRIVWPVDSKKNNN